MMKTYYTSGTGSSQTLTESNSPLKMRVYADREAAEGDIASLAEGELIATEEDGTAADTDSYITQLVKGVIQSCKIVNETTALNGSEQTSFSYTATEDGVLKVRYRCYDWGTLYSLVHKVTHSDGTVTNYGTTQIGFGSMSSSSGSYMAWYSDFQLSEGDVLTITGGAANMTMTATTWTHPTIEVTI